MTLLFIKVCILFIFTKRQIVVFVIGIFVFLFRCRFYVEIYLTFALFPFEWCSCVCFCCLFHFCDCVYKKTAAITLTHSNVSGVRATEREIERTQAALLFFCFNLYFPRRRRSFFLLTHTTNYALCILFSFLNQPQNDLFNVISFFSSLISVNFSGDLTFYSCNAM